jgi:hypothetical protein
MCHKCINFIQNMWICMFPEDAQTEIQLKLLHSHRCTCKLNSLAIDTGTHVKISHLVTSLPTSRQQDVFALLATSCQQVWNNLLTTCNNLVEIIRLVARLFWQVCYILDITRLSQPCVDNLVTSLLNHGCNKFVSTVL